jgi:thioredoxin-dependent peroxiredoxin
VDADDITRVGEAFELNELLTVVGRRLEPGEIAPDFTLDLVDAETSAIQPVTLADSDGMVRLLNVVNSLDTPVCQIETRRWENMAADLPAAVRIYTISMDLPFAQARWQSSEGVHHQMLSAHKSEQFGRDYGVLIQEWRLLQRAVFVVDSQGRIAYSQYVADQMREPDYTAAIDAVRTLLPTTQP